MVFSKKPDSHHWLNNELVYDQRQQNTIFFSMKVNLSWRREVRRAFLRDAPRLTVIYDSPLIILLTSLIEFSFPGEKHA